METTTPAMDATAAKAVRVPSADCRTRRRGLPRGIAMVNLTKKSPPAAGVRREILGVNLEESHSTSERDAPPNLTPPVVTVGGGPFSSVNCTTLVYWIDMEKYELKFRWGKVRGSGFRREGVLGFLGVVLLAGYRVLGGERGSRRVRGGHGGLNILPQKRWNVYRYDNRQIVEQDKLRYKKQKEAMEMEEEAEASEKRYNQLRQNFFKKQQNSSSNPNSTALVPQARISHLPSYESLERSAREAEKFKRKTHPSLKRRLSILSREMRRKEANGEEKGWGDGVVREIEPENKLEGWGGKEWVWDRGAKEMRERMKFVQTGLVQVGKEATRETIIERRLSRQLTGSLAVDNSTDSDDNLESHKIKSHRNQPVTINLRRNSTYIHIRREEISRNFQENVADDPEFASREEGLVPYRKLRRERLQREHIESTRVRKLLRYARKKTVRYTQ
ncbi:hypothetical protein AAMO2058_001561900 [Amorphochlora amoebiformis]